MDVMKKIGALICIIVIGTTMLNIVEKIINSTTDEYEIKRTQQHKQDMREGAVPKIGTTVVDESGVIDKSFISHLPLVIIDMGDKVIPVTKMIEYSNTGEGKKNIIFKYTGENPYVEGKINVIDNANHINTLSDVPTQQSYIKIRYRGNSSLLYEKKQYAIKLINEDGTNKSMPMLSMSANNDWVLNGSMQDASLIRNYMSYNIGSVLFPYNTEVRYCEVIFKSGESYKYNGVYLMMEQVEEGKNRVDITDYEKGDDLVSYLLCRDREDTQERQLSTYCSENDLCYGRLSVLYPKQDILDDYAFDYIEKDIDKIERILYSDDPIVFETWSDYLDVQSFVDYFLFNEMLGNYDAGNNSTYMYKDGAGKLCMGPLWDYDGAMDNYYSEINNPQYVGFQQSPWYDRLCKSKEFVSVLNKRYDELSDTILSADSLSSYADEVRLYLGNAALREWSRWANVYGVNSDLKSMEDQDGYMIDRIRDTHKEEVQRLKDYFQLKELYIEDGLELLEEDVLYISSHSGEYAVIILIVILVSSVILIRRRKSFR